MFTASLVEQRLTAVEAGLSDLQRRLASLPLPPNWLEQITGSFEDEPAFKEVLASGRALWAGDANCETRLNHCIE
jgi:hypothetical protein